MIDDAVYACPSGKKRYVSRSDADVVRITIRKHHDERMRVYRCRDCRGWHLGHGSHQR